MGIYKSVSREAVLTLVKDIESSSDNLKRDINKLMTVTTHPTISRGKKSMSAPREQQGAYIVFNRHLQGSIS